MERKPKPDQGKSNPNPEKPEPNRRQFLKMFGAGAVGAAAYVEGRNLFLKNPASANVPERNSGEEGTPAEQEPTPEQIKESLAAQAKEALGVIKQFEDAWNPTIAAYNKVRSEEASLDLLTDATHPFEEKIGQMDAALDSSREALENALLAISDEQPADMGAAAAALDGAMTWMGQIDQAASAMPGFSEHAKALIKRASGIRES